MDFVLKTTNPFKNINYFKYYFRILDATLNEKNPRIIYQIYLTQILCLTGSLYYFYLYYLYPTTEFNQIVFFDVVFLLRLEPSFHVMVAVLMLMCYYYFSLIYLKPGTKVNFLIKDVIVDWDNSLFVQPIYKNKVSCQLIKQYSFWMVYQGQLFVIFLGL